MWQSYRNWSARRQIQRDGTQLLREARRCTRRYGYRLPERIRTQVEAAIAQLATALAQPTGEGTVEAMAALDSLVSEHLAFARKSSSREYVESIGIAVIIALLLRAFVVEAFKIPSGSMIPTLQIGDHIFVNKFIYGVRIPWTHIKIGAGFRKPKRGEVIVFIYPKEPDKDFIKRIVAVEGDTIEVRDGQVYVNGAPVNREHREGDCHYSDYEETSEKWDERVCDRWDETVEGNTYTTVYDVSGRRVQSMPRQTIPPESVFVMGDNRDNSHDSRYWGYVPYDLIKGKAILIWWSWGEPEVWGRLRRIFHLIH